MASRPTKTAASSAAATTSTTRQQQRVTDLRAAKHISLLLVVASSVGCCGATGIISSTTGGGAAATAFVPTPSVLWSTKTTINTVGTNAVNFNARSTHRYWHHSAAGSSGSSSRFAPARMRSTVVSRDTEVVAEAPIAVATDAGSSAALAGLGSSSGSSVGATATAAASAAAANILGSQTVAAADRTTAAAAAVPSNVSLGPTTAAVAATSTQGGEEGDLVVAGAVSGAAAAAVRVKRRAALALPGTWCVTGLPKWMRILRRRMITKEDWLHVHAASGLVYQIGGGLWLLNTMGIELLAGIPQLDTAAAVPLCLLAAGVVNSLSSIPMVNSRSWVLNGVCASVMQLWYAWYVSGAYPASLAPADPWLAAAGLALLVISYVESEEAIASEKKARELVRQKDGDKAKASGHVFMRKGDYVVGDAINRFGSLANLVFNSPHLYATLVGSGWVERLGEAYPGGPALLFHAYFSLATSTSITLLAPTLYTRRLINAEALAAMQFIALAPFLTSAIDVAVMGSTTTGNPLELYLGFLH